MEVLGLLGAAGALAPTPEQIRAQLARIVESPDFSGSPRTKAFLAYIVEQTLAGRHKRLKQYTIATEVLGRGPSFNPELDPAVRLEAGKLRRALENYYLRAGTGDPVRISVPKGSYVPVFAVGVPGSSSLQAELGDAPTQADVQKLPRPLAAERLVILPAQCQREGAALDDFARGLTEQLIIEFARYRGIAVVPSSDWVTGQDDGHDLAGLGHRLGARFILASGVRLHGDQLRVTARLYDLRSTSVIWTDNVDADFDEGCFIRIQDEISHRIAGIVADYFGVLSYRLSIESVYGPQDGWTVHRAILRHRLLARTLTEDVYRLARSDLDVAAQEAPHEPMIWAAMAHAVFYGNVLGYDHDSDWLPRVHRLAQRAFELDHRCAYGHVVMAQFHLYRREFDEVFEICRRILNDNPHAPSTRLSAGYFRALAGDWSEGIRMVDSALARLVHPPGWAHKAAFLDRYRQKDYVSALREISKYNVPEHFTPPLLRAAALVRLGRVKDAEAAAAEVMRISPKFDAVAETYFRYLVSFEDLADDLREALRKVGLLVP